MQKKIKYAQHADAGDPRYDHAGAGLGQGSKRERRNAIMEFLLKCQLPSVCGQAAEPPAVGRLI